MPSETRITPERVVLVGTLLAALAYIQDIRYDFILDDVPLVLMNETITSWRHWKRAFTTHIFEANLTARGAPIASLHYRPVFKLWQILNYQLFGAVIPWWHITSLLLHAAAIVLVYQLGVKLLKQRWTAALAALLFAFHPIHTEAVAYIAASTDLLVTVFGLLAFLAYYRFSEESGGPGWYVASLLAAALAMLSKETAAMLPWLLVAYEALRKDPAESKPFWKRVVWTVPYFAVVGVYLVVRVLLFGFNAGPGPGASRLAALLDIPLVFAVYLRNLFWPAHLSFFYPAEWGSEWSVMKAIALAVVIAICGFLWVRYRDRGGVRLQLLWAAILFVPILLGVSTFGRDDWVHDRHMYIVSIPVCLIAAAVLTDPRWPRNASIAAASVILVFLLVELALGVPRFTDNTSVYASAVKVAPRNVVAHGFYAQALWDYGRREEALREYRITAELVPKSAGAHENYGAALMRLGRDDEATAQFETALRCAPKPESFKAYLLYELGEIELRRSDFSGAADHLREAVQLAPDALNYHALFAQALSRQGQTDQANKQMELEAGVRRQYVQQQSASRE